MSGVASRRGRICAVLTGASLVLGMAVQTSDAEARPRKGKQARAAKAAPYSPPYASIVVDVNSGRVLHGQNENELRHPASITKVMTLYLLFEAMERGRFRLDSPITMTAHAASMPPSKLGLRPGQSITVENAIKALVTKSANDVAAAVAEAVGGSEEKFAEMMTARAHSLGMTRTHYANASGLPDPEQITTARDLVTLGRAIQERFPRQYAYFSTHNFRYGNSVMRNHNRLLGKVEGIDGIKTGYTRASGFNLLSSVKRGDQHIIAVVLGGKSAAGRDQIMAKLIENKIELASRRRTAPAIAQARFIEPTVAVAQAPAPAPKAAPVEIVRAEPVREATSRLEPMRGESIETARPVQVASNGPVSIERARPAYVSGLQRMSDPQPTGSTEYRGVSLDGSTGPRLVAAAVVPTSTPSNMRWVTGPTAAAEAPRQKIELRAETRVARVEAAVLTPPAKIETARVETARVETASRIEPRPASRTDFSRPASARSGYMIQIGATDDAEKAQDLLARAKASSRSALGSATPFTEPVKSGSGTLYRARFAGLDENQAANACKALKRSGFGCFATKN
ncbi:MAG: D-alanyl-D-alanine carboxypeptidase [Beijerinckiaceae bacterium]|nr:D-alanyl-D-alanine carboxypeptidase [Beijerinckiaceae bacterium]